MDMTLVILIVVYAIITLICIVAKFNMLDAKINALEHTLNHIQGYE